MQDPRFVISTGPIETPRAFRVCSDEYRGNMGCYYFDQGIDMYELGQNAKLHLDQYYIFDAFKRERLWFGSYGNPFAYYGRMMDRYFRLRPT